VTLDRPPHLPQAPQQLLPAPLCDTELEAQGIPDEGAKGILPFPFQILDEPIEEQEYLPLRELRVLPVEPGNGRLDGAEERMVPLVPPGGPRTLRRMGFTSQASRPRAPSSPAGPAEIRPCPLRAEEEQKRADDESSPRSIRGARLQDRDLTGRARVNLAPEDVSCRSRCPALPLCHERCR